MAPTQFDFAKPYDIMTGVWTGMANVYGPDGVYWDSAPSRVVMYWKDATTLAYKQTIDHALPEPPAAAPAAAPDQGKGVHAGHFKAISSHVPKAHAEALQKAAYDILRVSFDLKIKGKAATGESAVFDVTGTESMPGVYLFQLRAKDGTGIYYNNQYFLDASQRNIVGPFVDSEGNAVQVVAQAFARVSYDVPEKYRG